MTLHVWLAFVAASVIMLLIPGPTVLMVVGDALANRSRRNGAPDKPGFGLLGCRAWGTVAGVASADCHRHDTFAGRCGRPACKPPPPHSLS